MTIIEMMVALSLLGMILTAVLLIYITGAGAWRKGDTRSELLQDALVTSSNLAVDIEQSTYNGLETGPNCVSIISLRDTQGNFELADDGSPLWQRWVVYYFQAGEVRKVEVPWTAPETERATPKLLSSHNPAMLLQDYLVGGRVLARNVYAADFTIIPETASVALRMELRKKRYGSQEPETVSYDAVLSTRN